MSSLTYGVWAAKVRSLDKQRRTVTLTLKVDAKTKIENIKDSVFDTILVDIVQSFVVDEVLSKLLAYKPNSYPEHFAGTKLKKAESFDENSAQHNTSSDFGGGSSGRAVEVQGELRDPITQGHKALRDIITTYEIVSSKQGIRATIGKGVHDLKSSDYSLHGNENHPNNNWFLTVEWGTGHADNVGAGWALNQSPGPTNYKKSDGTWIYGPPPESGSNLSGIHMKGKKGYFGFYDKRTRRPNAVWVKLFEEDFPSHFRKQLRERMSDVFV